MIIYRRNIKFIIHLMEVRLVKGVIIDCLGKLIIEKFGEERWNEALEKGGFSKSTRFLAGQDIDDQLSLNLVSAVCEVLGLSLEQAANAFGEYWVTVYAPKIYSVYYRKIQSSKDFLLQMDRIHEITTKNVPNAHPPRFEYEWKDEKTLLMTYKSERNLIPFFIGLIKGVGKYYKEELIVSLPKDNVAEIIFPS